MNIRAVKQPWRDVSDEASVVSLMLASGGDERILVDPATQRTRYATRLAPCPEEVFFSSSTASTVTPLAYRAAETAWRDLSLGRQRVDLWFESIRARLLAQFGIEGAEIVLAGSGTDAELIALAIAKSLLKGPVANIVMAPAETGGGVLRAAAGAHFLGAGAFGEARAPGAPLRGWEGADIEAAGVDMRDRDGHLRSALAIDAEARERTKAALEGGRDVLLHLLQTSKTGRSALSIWAALDILAEAPDRIVVLADCCQLRCSRARIRHLLRCGFMVAITGSKFFGGPPFSGALLLPPSIVARIGRLAPPAGLADFTSRLDWPAALRGRMRLDWRSDANLGLGLRWVAALEEMERYHRLPAAARREALGFFAGQVRARYRGVGGLEEIADPHCEDDRRCDSILSFVMTHPAGAAFSPSETAAVHARLRAPCAGAAGPARERIFHLGQPVAIGARTALRVCASAPMISDLVEGAGEEKNREKAVSDWVKDTDALFENWRQAMQHVSSA